MKQFSLVSIVAVLAAACQSATAQAPGRVVVRDAMVDGVNPAALAIWDVGNAAIDDDGMPDGSGLDAAAMAQLREAAQLLGLHADRLARADAIVAAGPDLPGGEVPEGVAMRAQIQAAIDADPEGFRAYSLAMAEEAAAIVAAVDGGDKEQVAFLTATFDGACQACHQNYWYVDR